jgi:hypothetical protein
VTNLDNVLTSRRAKGQEHEGNFKVNFPDGTIIIEWVALEISEVWTNDYDLICNFSNNFQSAVSAIKILTGRIFS